MLITHIVVSASAKQDRFLTLDSDYTAARLSILSLMSDSDTKYKVVS